MKRLILGLIGASVLASAAPALAQGYDNNDWRDQHRYDRGQDRDDRGRYDRGYNDRSDRGYHHRYGYGYGNGNRVCAWRYGERVCWWQR
jgi:hypothetical protein